MVTWKTDWPWGWWFYLAGSSIYHNNCDNSKHLEFSLKTCFSTTKLKPLKSTHKFGIESNQSTNGKVSWDIARSLHFVGFSILWRCIVIFSLNDCFWFISERAVLYSQVILWFVNSFSCGPVQVHYKNTSLPLMTFY